MTTLPVANPAKFQLGQGIRSKFTFYDIDGVTPRDPTDVHFKYAHSATPLVVTDLHYGVDGALVKDGTGLYHVDWLPSLGGIWFRGWYGTGSVLTSSETKIDVYDSFFG